MVWGIFFFFFEIFKEEKKESPGKLVEFYLGKFICSKVKS